MSVVDFDYKSLSRSEVDKAIKENKAQYLCSGNNYDKFYFLDNRIVATWFEHPDNQFDSDPSAGELSLDNFLAELKRIENIPDSQKDNIRRIIGENEAAIREREYNIEVSKTESSIDFALEVLKKSVKHLEELGIRSEWFISRDGKTEFETSKEDVIGINKA